MTHVTCRLTAKNGYQLRNPTLGNRVWATFTFFTCILCHKPKLMRKPQSGRVCPVQVYLSTRSGTWFVRRVWDNGLPLDLALYTRLISFLARWLPASLVASLFRRKANAGFDHALYGLLPSYAVLASSVVVNDDLPSRVLCGSVQVRPGVVRLTSSAVHFTDATHVDHVDAVICATGTPQSS